MNKILVFIVALVSIQVYSQELFSIKNVDELFTGVFDLTFK